MLSTIHQAKGLEWKAVFVIWLVDGRFPDGRALGEGGEEEERRLFYVAVTRAKHFLHLCHPVTGREGAMFGVFQRTSRFLRELPEELLEVHEPPKASRFQRGRVEELGDERWMDGEEHRPDY